MNIANWSNPMENLFLPIPKSRYFPLSFAGATPLKEWQI